MRSQNKFLTSLGLLAALSAAPSCAPPADSPPPVIKPEEIPQKGLEEAFSHDEPVGDVFADGRQLPAQITARLHACGKVRYSVLGNVLRTRGVNLDSAAADSAGALYRSGAVSLGAPNYDSRSGEADRNTTGGITRLYDILIAAADEMIANMANQASCQVAGQGAKLFDAGGCNADGFSCLLGMPVTSLHVTLCNDMLKDAKDQGIVDAAAQRLAVAAMAAPVFLCE